MTLEERARQWLGEFHHRSMSEHGREARLAALLRQVRREALEEAVKAADFIDAEDRWDPSGYFSAGAEACADAIRALMDNEGSHG